MLLARYPELRVVIDHGAKPNIAAGEYSPWAEQMARIAEQTNTFCKLSGLATEAGTDISYPKIEPYMQLLFDAFGVNRLMCWPVCNLAISYQEWTAMIRTFLSSFSIGDQQLILGGNAQRFYKLNI